MSCEFEIKCDTAQLIGGWPHLTLQFEARVVSCALAKDVILRNAGFEIYEERLFTRERIPMCWPRLDDWSAPVDQKGEPCDVRKQDAVIPVTKGREIRTTLDGDFIPEEGVRLMPLRWASYDMSGWLEPMYTAQVTKLSSRCFLGVWFDILDARLPSQVEIHVPTWHRPGLGDRTTHALSAYEKPSTLRRLHAAMGARLWG